ncbi:hypothetical protein BJ138DRAFT_1141203 [Hygrophoropsis aurantiaca]|uniref:Uncharacterized protein n=1 Tax=Hygrophoropsis aurantiaca TaxID=72124 RepID=A0ACB8AQH3_9AGAM|nr:hypothetical protein BJ138DRAFT_1141203 [Hygrophoropsis aurantiaca]
MAPTTFSKTSSKSQTEETTSSVPTGDVAPKDSRAYEHARHLVKEKRDHVRALKRKELVSAWKAGGMVSVESRHKSRTTRRHGGSIVWDDGEVERDIASLPSLPARRELSLPRVKPEPRPLEVKLADLVSFKPRKGLHSKDSEFEVVPRLRSVIALEESKYDVEPDEPWEHVSFAADDSAWKGVSYAQAVTVGAV